MIFSHVLYQLSYLGCFVCKLFYTIFIILSSKNEFFTRLEDLGDTPTFSQFLGFFFPYFEPLDQVLDCA